MKKLHLINVPLIFFLIFFVACTIKNVTKNQLKKVVDWEGYSSKSIYNKDSISEENFKGKWYAFRKSYGRSYQIYDEINCPQPYIAEIIGSKIKINLDSAITDFTLVKNRIILPYKNRTDTVFINLLTNDSLILTWKYLSYDNWEKKESLFYYRYFYKRSSRP